MKIAIIDPEIFHIINCIKILCDNSGIKYSFDGLQAIRIDGVNITITNKIRKISILWLKIDIYRDGEMPELHYDRIYSKNELYILT